MSNRQEPRDKRIASSTIAASGGLAAVIFSTQFFDIPKNNTWGVIFILLGAAAYFYAIYHWHKL